MSVFKAYDIRGIYGTDLTEALAEQIGRAFITFLGAKTVVVGRDMRPHSVPLSQALIRGMTMQGATVYDLGLCSTPICYFANGTLKADGSVMITASHNPGEYNGFKLCRHDAIPLSGDAGIKDLEKIVATKAFAPAVGGGKVIAKDVKAQYYAMLAPYINFPGRPKIAIDYANAMGSVEMGSLVDRFDATILYPELDGTFPNHEANPLHHETFHALSAAVVKSGALLGAYFDGDADRVGFTDEKGEIISLDLVIALIAKELLSRGPATILYDLRSSWAVKESIAANGGRPVMSRVGHAFIKNQMRQEHAIFAGELAGHFYFKENFTAESSALALILITNIVVKSGQPLSALVKPLQKYFYSGEINSKIADVPAAKAKVKERFKDGRQFELDGITTEYADWWFNVRASNTEPLIRLIVEAKTKALMEQKRDELLGIIRG